MSYERRAVFASYVAIVGVIWLGMADLARAQFTDLIGKTVIAVGNSPLRSEPPGGLVGTPGGVVGSTHANQKYKVIDQRIIKVVFFGRQLWLRVEGATPADAGWILSGSDDAPYQYVKPQG